MKLLIVDEDQHFCRVVTTVLENDGHSVTALSDPPAAMAVCASSAPDVLLLSGDLPGRAAHHLLREVRRRPGGDRIAAILMVENHSEEIRRLCDETGTHHVMIRPFSVLDLAGIVRAIDDPPPAPPAPSEVLHLDLHNVQQVARIWARESTGVLQLRGDPGGGSWITMARGGPLGPDSLTRLRAALFGGDIDFQPCEVDGVGDRAGLGVMLWEAAYAGESATGNAPTRAMTIARTRLTEAVAALPAPAAARRICEQLDAPAPLGLSCDQAGADIGEIATALSTLNVLGFISIQARMSVEAIPPRPRLDPPTVRTEPPPPPQSSLRPQAPPAQVGARSGGIQVRTSRPPDMGRPVEPARSQEPYRSPEPVRSVFPDRPRSVAPPDRPPSRGSVDRPRSVFNERSASVPPPERPWSVVRPDRPFHRSDSGASRSDPESRSAVSTVGSTSTSSTPPFTAPASAEHQAQVRRMRREVEILKGSDPWAVLVLPPDSPPDRVEAAAARLEDRYRKIGANSDGEMRELAMALLDRVRGAVAELTAERAPKQILDQPGDDAFRAGLKAMSEGDWASADKRFAYARDQNLDSPRNLAHHGWARFHNPDLPSADRTSEGLDLLRLAEQLDPTYADGQYFLAIVLHRKGDDDGALRRLRRALKSEPSHVSANALFRKLRKAPSP